jgi:hypothetical protein
MDETQWHHGRDGVQQGPVGEAELRRLAGRGELRPTDLVWRAGMTGWEPARLATPFFPAAVPPPLPPAGFQQPPPPPPASHAPTAGYAPAPNDVSASDGFGPPIGYAQPYPQFAPPRDLGQDAGMRLLIPVGRSAWAIVAGYLGLFSVLLVPAPFAVAVSILAIRDIRRDRAKHGMGRAIFGLVMGVLGTIMLVVMLVALWGNANNPVGRRGRPGGYQRYQLSP